MDSSKLINLLKTFSKSEIKDFGDFIDSPYYNKNKELAHFCAYLRKYAPHFPPKKIERKVVFKKLFPKEKYEEKKLNHLMNYLLRKAEQFIGLQWYESTEGLADYHIMSSFVDRGLEKHYHFFYKKKKNLLEASSFKNSDFYFRKYLLAETSSQLTFKNKIRRFDKSLQDTSDYFDLYYLSIKLKYTCEMLNRRNMLSIPYEAKLLEEIQTYLSRHPHEDIPVINIYYQILMMLTAEDGTPYFNKLKELLNKYKTYFHQDEIREMFGQGLNYCIRGINQGDSNFLTEAFDLYIIGIKNEWFNDDGYLSPWTFKNVIKAGLMLEKYDWAKDFIEKYTIKLAPKFRQNALHFNLADLYYSTKQFDKAHEHLSHVEFTDIYITIDSKKLLMKIFLESDEIDLLYSAIAAFKQFINRHKVITSKVKEQYKNYISTLNLLIKGDHKSLEECSILLDSDKPIAERNWLKRMVAIRKQ